MALTRSQVIESQEYLFLLTLNNAVRCKMAQDNIDAGTSQFDGWHYEFTSIIDAGITNPPEAGDVFIGGISNGADDVGGNGVTQLLYILKSGAPEEILIAQKALGINQPKHKRRNRK